MANVKGSLSSGSLTWPSGAAASAETEALRGFAQAVLEDWPESAPDGFDLQDLALKFGLIKEADPRPTEPCQESCWCAEYFGRDEWAEGVTCYRRTPILLGEALCAEISTNDSDPKATTGSRMK